MTPTQIARRSDALYMDTTATHRRQLCDMVAHRESDIDELHDEVYGLHCDIGRLEVENSKLRQQLADVTESMGRVEERCAKLREYITKLEQANIVLDSDNTELRNDMQDMEMIVSDSHKLRKLVKMLAFCADDHADCDKCPMNGAEPGPVVQAFCDEMADLLRELGVGVDV